MAEFSSSKSSILIVDDETDHAEVMSEALTRLGFRTDVAHNLAEARAALDRKRFDVIVTDLLMDGQRQGLELLDDAMGLDAPPPVILVTAVNDVPTSREALKKGAYDYIVKPLDLDEFRAQVTRAAEKSHLKRQNEVLEARLAEQGGFEGIIGRSAGMLDVVRIARQVAASDIPVLVLGESGTGKELVARAIHENSQRRKNRLVALNCAGLSESILEDELFGHVRGAYTGAGTDREGRFEHAHNGTLFLDEVGDMPVSMQAKLLRVLENGEVVRLGSNEPKRVNVRLVSATNRKLEEMVGERTFREDLYFRIKGVTITIPPLRDRREDVPLLAYFFMKQIAAKQKKQVDAISPDAQAILSAYSWPGNVRQLRHVIEYMVVLGGGSVLDVRDLPADIKPDMPLLPAPIEPDPADGPITLNNLAGMTAEQVEKEHIRVTLELTHGNREHAAKMLGMGERTLYRKLKEYGLG